MNKLIAMTDFVLEQEFTIEVQSLTNQWGSRVSRYNKIMSYAKFIKQPLELGMFVPCDEDGNVLEEPDNHEFYMNNFKGEFNDYYSQSYEYQQAKERCLFEGLEIDAVNHHISRGRSVEYLANFGTLQLTQTAINLIGL